MPLHTPAFLLFLAVVALLVRARREALWRKAVLVSASCLFYALFDARFALLLGALTFALHRLGRAIAANAHANAHPRRYAVAGVLLNLGLLGFFKYANFFLSSLPAGWDSPAVTLLLPIGISFYTFQGIAYSLEIYRGKLAPAGFMDLALYLGFFPKLLAGPLVRPGQFFGQLSRIEQGPDPAALAPALQLVLVGLVKKVLVADTLGALADIAFRAAGAPAVNSGYPAPLFWQGFYLYAFQIYADFSGYTDLARGSAALLGFQLPENFQQPYLSASLTAFWNRWHMSLTGWFREYLFFPLSRNLLRLTNRRWPRAVQAGVTLATMSLIGLWHGAAWTYLVWGAWHGSLLIVEQSLSWKAGRRWAATLQGVLTFHLVGLGWVLFRSASFPAAANYLKGLLSLEGMGWLPVYLTPVLLAGLLVFGLDLAARAQGPRLAGLARLRPFLVFAALVLLAGLAAINLAHGAETRPFIYGTF